MSERRKEPPAKTTGRPRRSKDEGLLSRSLTFRVRPPLYAEIQAAAEIEQRSLSEEIEARLLRSFRQEAIEKDRFGNPDVSFLANLIAATVSLEQIKTGNSFLKDEMTFKNVRASVLDALDSFYVSYERVGTKPLNRRRFENSEYKRIKDGPIDNAEAASVPLDKIMGR